MTRKLKRIVNIGLLPSCTLYNSDQRLSFPLRMVDTMYSDKAGSPYIQVEYLGETKVFSPAEISAMVLQKLRETAEARLGKTVKKAVITVPA